ncbi:ATP-binding protein [Cohaesibacter celericrescens]|uniref:histidine kinase n=1 Tax=Cohaesibacter celericrescens TaxID=2067669 RepID=A0A2N5XKI8_9HYPH|nr:ATP-binding protein [Cohaesibacter celericrescens]PLW75031.1 two-component sensor histidine kinase [Cohaesibacter celericrescens]
MPKTNTNTSGTGSHSDKPSLWSRLRLWPRSLAGQLLAALFLALLVAQGITILLFASERSNIAVNTTRGQVMERMASVVRVLNQTDESLHDRVIRAAEGPSILYRLQDRTTLLVPRDGTPESFFTHRLERRAGLENGTVRISNLDRSLFGLGRYYEKKSSEALDNDGDSNRARIRMSDAPPHLSESEKRHWVRRQREKDEDGQLPRFSNKKRHNLAALDMTIAVPLDNGKWLQVRTGVPSPPEQWGRPFLISMGVMATLIALVVILAVRKLTAPLRELEGASRKLGRGDTVEPLQEQGPAEVRNTIAAFNAMQDRLMRFVQDRTRMLAAVSHDLRTPITTLRLRVEFIDDDEMRDKILATLEEMQSMTDAVLAFAREDAAKEETKNVDVAALLSATAEDYADVGKDVRFDGPDSLIYSCRAVSLKRAIRNLTDNALRYAGNAAIHLRTTAKTLEIEISDTGPGIPPDKLDDVFAPFFRVEGSRNLETGGVGLGLSITRTIVRGHGGDIFLTNRPEGGLMATISLPR